MTSELLDDYEEGTWTPQYLGQETTPTYTTQTGRYTKVGRFVYCTGKIDCSSLNNSDASSYQIGSLPFTGNADHDVCLFTLGRYTNVLPQSELDGFTSVRFGGPWVILLDGHEQSIDYNHGNSSGVLEFALSYQL